MQIQGSVDHPGKLTGWSGAEVSNWMRSNRLQLNTGKRSSGIRHTSAEPSAICYCSYGRQPRAVLDNCSWLRNSHRQRCCHAVSCVMYGVGMFAVLWQLCSIRRSCLILCSALFTGCVAGYATSRLQQRNTRSTSCFPAPSTSVGAQCRRQTGTSIFSVWAHHTNAARLSLATVSRMHRFQVCCAHLPMPEWSGTMVSFQRHPTCRRFQLLPSPVVVILADSDPTYMAVHCKRSCISCGWKLPLEQSATRRYISSNAVFFLEPPQNLSLFPIIFFLTVFSF